MREAIRTRAVRVPRRPTAGLLGCILGLLASACGGEPAPPEAPARVTVAPAAPPPITPRAPEAVPPPEAPAAPIPGALPGDAVRAFASAVRRPGRASTAFDSRTSNGIVVLVMNSTTCSFCLGYAARFKALEAQYMPRGVDFVHVYPNRGESDAEKVEWHAKQGFRGGQILDTGAAIAKLLETEKTPTVYVLDAKHLIAYRGGVDDSPAGDEVKERPLANALEALLAGKPVEVTAYEAPG